LKELIDSYQQLLTKIEERIVYLGNEMKLPQTKESLKQLRRRRDTLSQEYDDLIYAMRKMAKYVPRGESG